MTYTSTNKDGILGGVQFGNHNCSIYQNKEQLFTYIVPYILDGLKNNLKCIYVVDDNNEEEVLLQFEKSGVKLIEYLKSGQLLILDKSETYMKDGYFDIDEMFKLIEDFEATSISEGYGGLRGAGEMTGFTNGLPGSEKLIEYEVRLNEFLANKKCTLLCLYNEKKFEKDLLNKVIQSHPNTVIYGKFYENKYFYVFPEYAREGQDVLPADSYETVIDTIIEE